MANYLYNGVELPKFPDLAADFKYKMLYSATWGYILYLTNEKPYYDGASICLDQQYQSDLKNGNSEFTAPALVGDTTYNADSFLAQVFWANFDMTSYDGSLYLAASDPVPVNPADPIDPTALLMGWLVGRRIAGQRSKV